jgi:hypothetical protein
MSAIAYTVIATLPDAPTTAEYIHWLNTDHLQKVVAAGARRGDIVRIEQPAEPHQVETRYEFPDRQAFEVYLKTAAPGLRAEGLEKFPAERGVKFERRVGIVMGSAGS